MKARYGKQLMGLMGLGTISIILYAGHVCFYQKEVTTAEIVKKPVAIPVIFLCDEATHNKSNEKLIKEFNTVYKDQYYIDVEWFTGNAADYRARMKMLNSVNELPAIITDVGFDPAFYKLLVENKQIINLAPYFLEDIDWQECFTSEVIESVVEENGELYIMPLNTTYYSGIFWNKELFKKAGIESFPKTWEEFWKVCERLQECGIIPLSLHTEGTSWASMLLATSFMGQSEEGCEFMKEVFPSTYDVDVFYEMLDVYIKAFEYTTEDAIGKNFDVAEKHFYNEETAMIPNGRWMVESLSNNPYATKGFEDKISFSMFPGDVLIGTPAMSGWAVSANYSKEVQEGAIAFLKFRNQKDKSDTEESLNPKVYSFYEQVLKDYLNVVKQPFKLIPNYQLKWNSLIQDKIFNIELPKLLNHEITPETFIKKMDEAVQYYNTESQ